MIFQLVELWQFLDRFLQLLFHLLHIVSLQKKVLARPDFVAPDLPRRASRILEVAARSALTCHPHRKAKQGLLNIWFYEILSSITRKAPGTAKVYGSHIRRRPSCSRLRVGKSPRTSKQPLHWCARNCLTGSVHLCWTAVQIIWPMRKRRWRDSKEVWQTSNRRFGHSAALFGFGSSMWFPVVKV
jgi:hypothetical protein